MGMAKGQISKRLRLRKMFTEGELVQMYQQSVGAITSLAHLLTFNTLFAAWVALELSPFNTPANLVSCNVSKALDAFYYSVTGKSFMP